MPTNQLDFTPLPLISKSKSKFLLSPREMTIKFLTILWASTKGVAEVLLTRLKMFKTKDQIRIKNEQKVQHEPDAEST